MYPKTRPRLRDGETWAEVRRCWEAGETAASLARRYDVGLSNLWRRRAAEGWDRRQAADRPPEPVEGWDRHGRAKLEAFETDLRTARELAVDLIRVMQGGPIGEAPLWHLGFVYHWRADHLGPEVAAMDRERGMAHDWADAVWEPDGRLKPVWVIDHGIIQRHRAMWREQVGLPPGAAEHVP